VARREGFSKVQCIDGAKVPIVKCVDELTQVRGIG
jgi:DNA polymerase sigma